MNTFGESADTHAVSGSGGTGACLQGGQLSCLAGFQKNDISSETVANVERNKVTRPVVFLSLTSGVFCWFSKQMERKEKFPDVPKSWRC